MQVLTGAKKRGTSVRWVLHLSTEEEGFRESGVPLRDAARRECSLALIARTRRQGYTYESAISHPANAEGPYPTRHGISELLSARRALAGQACVAGASQLAPRATRVVSLFAYVLGSLIASLDRRTPTSYS